MPVPGSVTLLLVRHVGVADNPPGRPRGGAAGWTPRSARWAGGRWRAGDDHGRAGPPRQLPELASQLRRQPPRPEVAPELPAVVAARLRLPGVAGLQPGRHVL